MPKFSSLIKALPGLRTLVGNLRPIVAGGSKKFITWPALTSLTAGTNTTPVAGTRYSCSIFIPHQLVMTGIGYLVGSVGGTDSAIVELHDADGRLLAHSALAGTVVGTSGAFQEIPFTAPITIVGPGWYFMSVTMNGTTARLRTIPTALGVSQTALTDAVAGTFGTLGTFTPPTTFTADEGPIAYTY